MGHLIRGAFIIVVLGLTGCRVGFESATADLGLADAGVVDLGTVDAADAGTTPVEDDAGVLDVGFDTGADVGIDAGEPADTGRADSQVADAEGDAGPPDLGNNCTPANPDTLALFEFGSTMTTSIADSIGTHSGSVRSNFASGNIDYTSGPPGCGTAARGFDRAEAYVDVADHPDWQLASGALEFWIYPESPQLAQGEGIVGRDELGNDFGHFSVLRSCSDELVVRFQTPTASFFRCSSGPMLVDQWQHVGINFGPPDLDLYVDGIPLTGTQTVAYGQACGSISRCGAGIWTDGIAGNSVRLIIGATNYTGPDSAPLVQGYFHGAIDHLAIHGRRQPFQK